jgi:hypothetical protein
MDQSGEVKEKSIAEEDEDEAVPTAMRNARGVSAPAPDTWNIPERKGPKKSHVKIGMQVKLKV